MFLNGICHVNQITRVSIHSVSAALKELEKQQQSSKILFYAAMYGASKPVLCVLSDVLDVNTAKAIISFLVFEPLLT
jgi:hypothetical protein